MAKIKDAIENERVEKEKKLFEKDRSIASRQSDFMYNRLPGTTDRFQRHYRDYE